MFIICINILGRECNCDSFDTEYLTPVTSLQLHIIGKYFKRTLDLRNFEKNYMKS